jgi:hypothetical protein
MTFEGSEDGMLNDGLEQGDDEDEKKNYKDAKAMADGESSAESEYSASEEDGGDTVPETTEATETSGADE